MSTAKNKYGIIKHHIENITIETAQLSEKVETKGGTTLFSMHLERSGGESNKFESPICIDCGDVQRGGDALTIQLTCYKYSKQKQVI